MADSRALVTAAAALLVIAMGLNWPALTRHVPRPAWGLAVIGALIPLLDAAASYLAAEDQIGALTHAPFFAGPLTGLGLILLATIAVAVWSGARPAGIALSALTAGFALHIALQALTPRGVPWLAPFNLNRQGWGLFPAGHPLLLGLLGASVLALEALPRYGGWIRRTAAGIAVAYGLAAVGGYLWAEQRAPAPASADTLRTVEPDGLLPHRWRIIDRTSQDYRVTTLAMGEPAEGQPRQVARWNNEPLLRLELEDPVVYRLYFRTFLHPVAELTASSSQTILTVQELAQRLTGSEGPTFVLKTDSDGRNRLYRLERFD